MGPYKPSGHMGPCVDGATLGRHGVTWVTTMVGGHMDMGMEVTRSEQCRVEPDLSIRSLLHVACGRRARQVAPARLRLHLEAERAALDGRPLELALCSPGTISDV
eukprot:3401986-Prymnesium_polylepis.1